MVVHKWYYGWYRSEAYEVLPSMSRWIWYEKWWVFLFFIRNDWNGIFHNLVTRRDFQRCTKSGKWLSPLKVGLQCYRNRESILKRLSHVVGKLSNKFFCFKNRISRIQIVVSFLRNVPFSFYLTIMISMSRRSS